MHIPFIRDRQVQEGQHNITLADNSNQEEEDRDRDGAVEDPSPGEDFQQLPETLEVPIAANPRHAIEVPNGLVDVLYENQRGSFLCGIPLYSSAGLWITDPHAWTSIDHKYTPFTIFTAAPPDPTWEWVWKRWFVDMSGDVDENGWSYNINFNRHSWHGHHIWYHSFVRRRRWLRKRRKVPKGDRIALRKKNPAEDYFTIYSASRSMRTSQQNSSTTITAYDEDDDDGGPLKLENLGEFYERLRAARLDREKLDAVDNFLHNGKDLAGLAGEMRHILRFMIFQESRRQLLTLLAVRCQALEKVHGGQTVGSEADRWEGNPHQCVKNAIEMADLLVNKLSYFSDRVKVTRAEEDAELDRITATRLRELSVSRDRDREQSREEEEEPSMRAAMEGNPVPSHPEKTRRPGAGSRKVSFADDASHGPVAAAAAAATTVTGSNQDDTIVEEWEEESPERSRVHHSAKDKGKEKER
ncbi:protein of unknown function [Taphrina deformans PYCC 5710]|uniref:Peroxin/Ferlin domain-containing protein n=1 Tax=Taphrina deformans (strain PYCC 5710 / ATCC 11124 / CBS 356.35 / IMI 108563 / JCM 9778 / NBRC 8474) TaxID=1097556 RepID=R4XGI9_TAPDE|nr:protein of unknown function [Taphrina deformans PYCC 5710]|eukprot:CCG84893.1 protein of unknown function [Taphrina deformans PYCC 5710]